MVKAGGIEVTRWQGHRLMLYWEVWSEVKPLRPTFIVELESDSHRKYKAAFDTLAEADEDLDRIKQQHAIEIAKTAFRLKRGGH